MNAKVRITVLKRSFNPEFVEESTDPPSAWKPCARLKAEEYVSEGVNMPEGFCSWAWADIQKYVMVLARGGDFVGVQPGRYVTCCTDGFRPVFFQVERIQGGSI